MFKHCIMKVRTLLVLVLHFTPGVVSKLFKIAETVLSETTLIPETSNFHLLKFEFADYSLLFKLHVIQRTHVDQL